ncbi:MAG: tRNA pseudouridine(55) synthase TruB [Oligoflexia bacterium]|nr:tRNA pseudouridine(55) synthase TruB [Oligoflexia bacterium]
MESKKPLNGAFLIDKHAGITSFGIVEHLQRRIAERQNPGVRPRRSELPKMGHGGTLDPFATGLLVVCTGRAVKLARYFLGSLKEYEGTIRFGETTIPGDPTAPVSERSEHVPASREQIQEVATRLTLQSYLQTPPMHSAKKKDGRPLYELARQGVEVEREPKACQLYSFEILSYEKPCARFRLRCSSGTYVRTLAQDLARLLGSVAMLDALRRSGSGPFRVESALALEAIDQAVAAGQEWDELPCWIPFDRMLEGYDRAEASEEDARALFEGRQNVLFNLLKRVEPGPARTAAGPEAERRVAIYSRGSLIAVAERTQGQLSLERVFTPDPGP